MKTIKSLFKEFPKIKRILITLRKLFPAAQPKRRQAVSNANKPADHLESAVDRLFEPREIQLKYFSHLKPENDQKEIFWLTSIQRPYCQKRNLSGIN